MSDPKTIAESLSAPQAETLRWYEWVETRELPMRGHGHNHVNVTRALVRRGLVRLVNLGGYQGSTSTFVWKYQVTELGHSVVSLLNS